MPAGSAVFVIGTVAPILELPLVEGSAATVPTVTPNGDGSRETVAIPFSVNEAATVTAVVSDAAGKVVRHGRRRRRGREPARSPGMGAPRPGSPSPTVATRSP